jgi:hypothetical protein
MRTVCPGKTMRNREASERREDRAVIAHLVDALAKHGLMPAQPTDDHACAPSPVRHVRSRLGPSAFARLIPILPVNAGCDARDGRGREHSRPTLHLRPRSVLASPLSLMSSGELDARGQRAGDQRRARHPRQRIHEVAHDPPLPVAFAAEVPGIPGWRSGRRQTADRVVRPTSLGRLSLAIPFWARRAGVPSPSELPLV